MSSVILWQCQKRYVVNIRATSHSPKDLLGLNKRLKQMRWGHQWGHIGQRSFINSLPLRMPQMMLILYKKISLYIICLIFVICLLHCIFYIQHYFHYFQVIQNQKWPWRKLQKIATTAVDSKYKVKWLKWWNLSPITHEALHFCLQIL